VASRVFSLPLHKIRLLPTSTSRIANTSPSAASATADLNGKAVYLACTALAGRLKEEAARQLQTDPGTVSWQNEDIYVDGQKTAWTWSRLVMAAYLNRVSLSEHAHYATPEIWFDKSREKGHPFAYHVYGTAITEVTVDCLRGIYEVDAVKLVHDFGSSMNPAVDLGQVEGGLVQGIGWMTMEELIYDKAGRLRANALSTYKVPDIYAVPKATAVEFLQTPDDNLAIFRSKAVGEPPLMYGIGTYFALRQAILAFNPATAIPFDAPMTPEKVLGALYPEQLSTLQEKYEQIPGDMALHT
jgi:xanthine dehydrogenase large subunit